MKWRWGEVLVTRRAKAAPSKGMNGCGWMAGLSLPCPGCPPPHTRPNLSILSKFPLLKMLSAKNRGVSSISKRQNRRPKSPPRLEAQTALGLPLVAARHDDCTIPRSPPPSTCRCRSCKACRGWHGTSQEYSRQQTRSGWRCRRTC